MSYKFNDGSIMRIISNNETNCAVFRLSLGTLEYTYDKESAGGKVSAVTYKHSKTHKIMRRTLYWNSDSNPRPRVHANA